ncbi:mycothione reductase [Nocardioides marmoraquaticus]
MTHYDLAVIGTGSGNSIVDERFSDRRVAILEEGRFGGTCLNVGCIPTKMFVYPADVARQAGTSAHLGLRTAYDGVDWPGLRDRIFGRIDAIERGGRDYRKQLPNVDVHEGHAEFVDDHELVTGDGRRITADQVVIAAGSRVQVAEIPGIDDVPFHTSDTVMRLEELPRRMVVIGGGYVASELSHVFSSLGTRVTQVQRGARLLMAHDHDVSQAFTEAAEAQWDVRLSVTTSSVRRRDGDTVVVTLGDGTELEADVLLVATGRVPNADRLGLEHTSIATEPSGSGRIVSVDRHQRASVEGIWALGDVANHDQLKHVANAEARVVQHNLLHPDDLVASTHEHVPAVVFSSPQVASVGLTEQQAQEQGVAHRVVTHDYAGVAYGWAMDVPEGRQLVKLLATPDGGRLLGAHVVGAQASLLLQPLVQAMALDLAPLRMAREQYWPHPSLAEVVENALLQLDD